MLRPRSLFPRKTNAPRAAIRSVLLKFVDGSICFRIFSFTHIWRSIPFVSKDLKSFVFSPDRSRFRYPFSENRLLALLSNDYSTILWRKPRAGVRAIFWSQNENGKKSNTACEGIFQQKDLLFEGNVEEHYLFRSFTGSAGQFTEYLSSQLTNSFQKMN